MIFRFGLFELNTHTEQLLKTGHTVRLQPQPYKLLCLLTSQAGNVVTRDDIRATLWTGQTYVDYEQGVNFAMKQVRDALGDDADNPVYIQTIPKRGYRFIAPVDATALGVPQPIQLNRPGTDFNLQKALWFNIAELRLAEESRIQRRRVAKAAAMWGGVALAVAALAALAVAVLLSRR
jgi:DNA-binding winged helix-turn-helix (wHTH) protein